MIRLVSTIAIVAAIYQASPHRDGRDGSLAAAARDAAAALPRPAAAEAALAAALLRGALPDGARAPAPGPASR